MASLYLHIPFCKSRCIYCDFYSGTDTSQRASYVQALCNELRLRSMYLPTRVLDSIYFGGGTPSLLQKNDFERLFEAIHTCFTLSPAAEITLECNPDDLTPSYVAQLQELPFNRISIGIQSFDDVELRFLNRRHTAQQAQEAVALCQAHGFDNISIDLMYGLPNQTPETWRNTLAVAMNLGVQHLSAYSLMYEEGSPLSRLRNAHKITELDEATSVALFEQLIDTVALHGFEQYEISNFCLPSFHSRHNSIYWHGVPYLGVGAAAHSFDGVSRQWNVANTVRYMAGVAVGKLEVEREDLTDDERYNEFVFTALRTRSGINLSDLEHQFGNARLAYCLRLAQPYIDGGQLELHTGQLALTRAGIFVSDGIMSDLCYVD
ncbi:MAG: radical SAM family heme chaperone HemW [Paludibacteraceae bacterium]|nr:radical SAM family heme chaperone HemW [Paludibacteraceae bacterium]